MYGSWAVTLLVLISDDVINRILKLDIQTNILIYVTRCCTNLTSKVLKERTFGQSSGLLFPDCKQDYLKSIRQQERLSIPCALKKDCLRHLFIDVVVINQTVRKDNVVID